MNNTITLKIQADKLIRMALEEDVSSEDVTTCAVIEPDRQARADLLCKQDGRCLNVSFRYWIRKQRWSFAAKMETQSLKDSFWL